MEEFQKQTGKDFGYRPEKSERERLDAIAKAREWWKKEGQAQLAAKIAEDHSPVVPAGDLFLSEDEITARVAAIDGPDAARRRQTIANLGDAYSYRIQRALLNAVHKEQDAAERLKILQVLKKRASLWHVPTLAKIMEADKDAAVRVAAAGAIKAVVADKTTWLWWIRIESRESGLEAARRIAGDVKAAPDLRRAAVDILRAWDSWMDRPLLTGS
jgi:ribosomal protein S8E